MFCWTWDITVWISARMTSAQLWSRRHHLPWADVIRVDFQTVISRYLHNVNTRFFCTADRMFRTIIMQNSRLVYACFPIKIDEDWIDRFCVRYDWWRRLQPTSSVSPVCLSSHDCFLRFFLLTWINLIITCISNNMSSKVQRNYLSIPELQRLCLHQPRTAGNVWVRNQRCSYWCPGAKVPSHQYPQCCLNSHCIGTISYRNMTFTGDWRHKIKLKFEKEKYPVV